MGRGRVTVLSGHSGRAGIHQDRWSGGGRTCFVSRSTGGGWGLRDPGERGELLQHTPERHLLGRLVPVVPSVVGQAKGETGLHNVGDLAGNEHAVSWSLEGLVGPKLQDV